MRKFVLLLVGVLFATVAFSQLESKTGASIGVGVQGVELGISRVVKLRFIVALSGSIGYNFSEFTLWASGIYERPINQQSILFAGAKVGLRRVSNDQFTVTLGLAQPCIGYTYAIGSAAKHRLSATAGYIIGETDYRQRESNAFGELEYIGTYKPKRFDLSLSYSYWF